MKMRRYLCACMMSAVLSVAVAIHAEDGSAYPLPPPVTTGGMPLMDALSNRHSNREIDERPLAEQELSNLLWAAWGVNRQDGRRTAPSSQNKQEIEVYVAMESGVWLYDAVENQLVLAAPVDATSTFNAPVTLLYVAPADHYAAGMHAGSLYQNVGLYCASAGLANVVKRSGRDALDGTLPLPPGHQVVIIQLVGYPK